MINQPEKLPKILDTRQTDLRLPNVLDSVTPHPKQPPQQDQNDNLIGYQPCPPKRSNPNEPWHQVVRVCGCREGDRAGSAFGEGGIR